MRVNKKNGKIKLQTSLHIKKAGKLVVFRPFRSILNFIICKKKNGRCPGRKPKFRPGPRFPVFRGIRATPFKSGISQAQPPLLNGCAALPIANAKNATPKIRYYSSPRRKSTANISELNPTATGEYTLPPFVSFTCAITEVR